MTIEEKLKALILNRYHSIREFTILAEIPYSTIDSIFKRGIGNSSVSNVIKICKTLGLSVDALANGEIAPAGKPQQTRINDRIEIKEVLADTRDILIHSGEITLDGNPIGKTGIDSIIDAIDVGVELAKWRNQ